jgi:predicted DNA-binding transcriptional regulator AlpA
VSQLLKTPEAAKALNMHRVTLWRMTVRREIPRACYLASGRVRPRYRYDLEALRAWMQRPA